MKTHAKKLLLQLTFKVKVLYGMDVRKSESGQRKRKKLKRKNTTKYDTIAPRDDVNVIFPIACNFPIVSTLLSETEKLVSTIFSFYVST